MRGDLTTKFLNSIALDSSTPVVLVEFRFASGTVYVSDKDITPTGGPAHLGIVASWGQSKAWGRKFGPWGAIGSEGELIVANTTFFSNNFFSNIAQDTEVVQYLYFPGDNYSDKAELSNGRFFVDTVDFDELNCRMRFMSPLERADQPLGRIIDRHDFPYASYHTVGRALGYVLNKVNDVQLFPLQVGWQSALVDDTDATTTGNMYFRVSGQVGKVTDLPTSGSIWIGDELISYSSRAYSDTPDGSHPLMPTNYIVVSASGRGANARPYQQGTVAFQNLSSYIYGFPYHASIACNNVKVGGIVQSSGYTVNLSNSAIIPGEILTTVAFDKHPRRVRGANSHSHIGRRTVRRVGSTNAVAIGSTYTSTADVPTNVGKAQKGVLTVTAHISALTPQGGYTTDILNLEVSSTLGKFVTQIDAFKGWVSGQLLPPAITMQIPINNPDFTANTFTARIRPYNATSGSAIGTVIIDSVKFEVEYTGGDSINAEVKTNMPVAASIGVKAFTTAVSSLTMTAQVPSFIPIPQHILVDINLRILNLTYSGGASGLISFTISGPKITTTIPIIVPIGTGQLDIPVQTVKINTPDLTANSFSVTVNMQASTGIASGTFAVDDCTFNVEYPQGDAEVIGQLEIISDGPTVTADVSGVYSSVTSAIDSCDTASQWVSSNSGKFAVSQETTLKTEGTAAVKAVSLSDGSVPAVPGLTGVVLSSTDMSGAVGYNPGSVNWQQRYGTYFIHLSAGIIPTNFTVGLAKVGAPVATLVAKIYHVVNNTYVSVATSTNTYDTAGLSTSSYTPVSFLFSVSIPADDNYFIVVEKSGGALNSSNYFYIQTDNTTGGNFFDYYIGWNVVSNHGNMAYSLIGSTPGTAGVGGDGIERSMTHTISSKNLSTATFIKADFAYTGNGSFNFQFGETTASENSFPVVISNDGSYHTVTFSIVSIPAANRNAVTKLKVIVTDASQAMTIYMDNIVYDSGGTTLLTNPADQLDYFNYIVGVSSDINRFAALKTACTSAGYTFTGIVGDYMFYLDLLKKFQEQGRFAVWHSLGTLKYQFLPDVYISAWTITNNDIMKDETSARGLLLMSMRGSSINEIANNINISYSKRWYKNSFDSHLLIIDATSQNNYGIRNLDIEADFINTDAMASDVADYYKAQMSNEKRLIKPMVPLDFFALEQYDSGTIIHGANVYRLNELVYIEEPPLFQPGYCNQDDQGGDIVLSDAIELSLREVDKLRTVNQSFDQVSDVDSLADVDSLI